jgi:hypothetical protein
MPPDDPQAGEPPDDPTEFRRRYASEIETKLTALRQAYAIALERDPDIYAVLVDKALWFTDSLQMPRPPWLEEAAAKFPAKLPAVRAGIGRWKCTWTWDNSDIGKRRGPRSDREQAVALARELLEAGWSKSKPALALRISSELKRRASEKNKKFRGEPETVEGWITAIWRELRPDQSLS